MLLLFGFSRAQLLFQISDLFLRLAELRFSFGQLGLRLSQLGLHGGAALLSLSQLCTYAFIISSQRLNLFKLAGQLGTCGFQRVLRAGQLRVDAKHRRNSRDQQHDENGEPYLHSAFHGKASSPVVHKYRIIIT